MLLKKRFWAGKRKRRRGEQNLGIRGDARSPGKRKNSFQKGKRQKGQKKKKSARKRAIERKAFRQSSKKGEKKAGKKTPIGPEEKGGKAAWN